MEMYIVQYQSKYAQIFHVSIKVHKTLVTLNSIAPLNGRMNRIPKNGFPIRCSSSISWLPPAELWLGKGSPGGGREGGNVICEGIMRLVSVRYRASRKAKHHNGLVVNKIFCDIL